MIKRVLRTIGLTLIALSITAGNLWALGAKDFPAMDVFFKQRDFMEEYVMDKEEGGFYFWVRGDGSLEDPKKFSLFQANVILWLGGLQSQHPSDRNIEMIKSAANFLVSELYKGDGHWYEFHNPETDENFDFYWNPRSETFIAYALMEAYMHTGDITYQKVADETLERQKRDNPDGKVMAEFSSQEDVGFRFPEHMGHYEDFMVMGDKSGLEWVNRFDQEYRGRYAIEHLRDREGNEYEFRHGLAIIDKFLYAYFTNNEEAWNEAEQLYKEYKIQGHQDDKTFRNEIPGEAADNGRDYYDKRLSMAMIQWTKSMKSEFRIEALDMWEEVTRFWDKNYPNGFYINTVQDRKTCFSINQPAMLIDLTPPEIVRIDDQQKALWNHQLTVVIKDPDYKWNDHEMVGIGVDPGSLNLDVPKGMQYGNTFVKSEECEDCYAITTNFLAFRPATVKVKVADFFGNHEEIEIRSIAGIALSKWWGLNRWSYMYYATVLLVIYLIVKFFIKTQKKRKKDSN